MFRTLAPSLSQHCVVGACAALVGGAPQAASGASGKPSRCCTAIGRQLKTTTQRCIAGWRQQFARRAVGLRPADIGDQPQMLRTARVLRRHWYTALL